MASLLFTARSRITSRSVSTSIAATFQPDCLELDERHRIKWRSVLCTDDGYGRQDVLHSKQMRNAITVRLPEHLAQWLETAAAKAGISQGSLIRDQLEKARTREDRPFMRLAGKVSADRTLSLRKGFSKK
jgi:predicted HicB family RNase H-like nuclease